MRHNTVEKRHFASLSKTSFRLKAIRSKIIAKREDQQKLLNLGLLITRAELAHLDAQTLYGALLTIKDMTELKSNLNFWKRLGKEYMISE